MRAAPAEVEAALRKPSHEAGPAAGCIRRQSALEEEEEKRRRRWWWRPRMDALQLAGAAARVLPPRAGTARGAHGPADVTGPHGVLRVPAEAVARVSPGVAAHLVRRTQERIPQRAGGRNRPGRPTRV